MGCMYTGFIKDPFSPPGCILAEIFAVESSQRAWLAELQRAPGASLTKLNVAGRPGPNARLDLSHT